MPEVIHTLVTDSESPDDSYVLVQDAIGQGVDVRLYCERGIVSLVFVIDGLPEGPSADVQLEDLEKAIDMLKKGL